MITCVSNEQALQSQQEDEGDGLHEYMNVSFPPSAALLRVRLTAGAAGETRRRRPLPEEVCVCVGGGSFWTICPIQLCDSWLMSLSVCVRMGERSSTPKHC